MSKQRVEIDYQRMQAIIDESEGRFSGGMIEFLNHCADQYNKEHGTKLYGQILYDRIKRLKLLTTNFVPSRKEVSPDQFQRKEPANKKECAYNNSTAGGNEFDEIITQLKEKFNIKCKAVLTKTDGIVIINGVKSPCLSRQTLLWFLRGFAWGGGWEAYTNHR